ncbi:MAG: hypothetical protein SGI71_13505 [Verrucomicrobiota bacterium]|nr:hypothetical protein [Verrucomicrobiota bacterium]
MNDETEVCEKSGGGRPTKRTPDRTAALLQAIESGMPYKSACAIAGIHFDTFNEWRKTNSEFSEQVEGAQAIAIQRAVNCIMDAALKDWKAAAWFLERRACDEFSKQKWPFE